MMGMDGPRGRALCFIDAAIETDRFGLFVDGIVVKEVVDRERERKKSPSIRFDGGLREGVT